MKGGSQVASSALFMLAMLIAGLIAGCDRQTLEPGTSDRYAPGQRWSYHTRPEEPQSTVVILKLDSSPSVGTIVHVSLQDVNLANPQARGGVQQDVTYLPFSVDALDESVQDLLEQDVPLPEFRDAYEGWRDKFRGGEASVWSQPVAEVLETIESNLTGRPPRQLIMSQPDAPTDETPPEAPPQAPPASEYEPDAPADAPRNAPAEPAPDLPANNTADAPAQPPSPPPADPSAP